ncbi:MAG: SRPBCC family protein [Anaerolineales bacterium]|jgi:uncharacterized membrane protein
MIEFTNKIYVERPLKEVFEFISDFENLPKWNYYVTEANKLVDGPVDVGTQYHQVRKTDQQQFQVVEYEQNQVVAIETLPPERKLRMRFQFDPVNGGVEITDTWQLEADAPGPLNWLAKKKVKAAVSQNLAKLKRLLEHGRVTLQDGRVEMLERVS